MFLKFKYFKDENTVICSRKIKDKEIFLGVKVIKKDENEIEVELDKEKFIGRNSIIPKAILESNNFSNEEIETVEPIIAFKTKVDIKPQEEEKINFII